MSQHFLIAIAKPCKTCGNKPGWHPRMKNTLRCAPTAAEEEDCDGPLTRSSPESAVADWNARHG